MPCTFTLPDMVLYTPGQMSGYPDEPVGAGFRFHFLGGAGEVGNVGCVLEDRTGTRLLIDYGLAPTSPPRYPGEAPKVKDAIITHAHIDHIGMAPWLVANHDVRLHGTPLTAALSGMMWRDTYKVSNIEGYPLPWDRRDLEMAESAWRTHEFGEWTESGDWRWRLHRAGHVPGAAMIEIETPERRILWSGDLDTRDSPNVRGAAPLAADILFLEGTYGGREHPERRAEEKRFTDKVIEVLERGGMVLVPAFASGRGQDVLRLLRGMDLSLDVHYDGMGKAVTKHWLEHEQHLTDPDGLRDIWRWVRRVSSKSDRKKALSADVIVTTSGMLDGGPALWYLNRIKHDAESAILLTGYQAEGSGGRSLVDTGRLPIFGRTAEIRCEVERFDLSNHAGHLALVDFAAATGAADVVLFHAPNEGIDALAEAIVANGQRVHKPANGETYLVD